MLIVAFAVVGCDDSSSASAEPNDEPGVESSSSIECGVSSSSVIASEAKQSSNSSAKSSSSVIASETKQSSSSSVGNVNCSALLEGETGWDWNVPKECRLNPEITYGTMTDSRDGKIYKTVTIAPAGTGYSQTWMAENLNYADSVTTASIKGKSWCYNDVAANCDVEGRLYTWAAAIDSVKLATDATNPLDCGYRKTCGLTGKVQGICPDGWHLPSKTEWETLFTAVGGGLTAGKVLKSQTGWYRSGNGTDAFGFFALPTGDRYNYGSFGDGSGYGASFWSSTEVDVGNSRAYIMDLYYSFDKAFLDYVDKFFEFSVRCLKD